MKFKYETEVAKKIFLIPITTIANYTKGLLEIQRLHNISNTSIQLSYKAYNTYKKQNAFNN